jgi:hypothetical protein
MITPDTKIVQLEQQIQKLTVILNELEHRIKYLERENNRRKSEITQSVHKKG